LIDLSDENRRQIVDHCRAALPNEGCGMLALDGDRVVKVYPTGNDDSSPTSYTIPPQDHYDALMDAESHGWRLGGVFHSHPRGPATMSATDLARVTDPDWVYVVVNLNGDEPDITGWRDGVTLEI
jgi:proteasome lid subunit RPN8/RPN11